MLGVALAAAVMEIDDLQHFELERCDTQMGNEAGDALTATHVLFALVLMLGVALAAAVMEIDNLVDGDVRYGM